MATGPTDQVRVVRCPKCHQLLPEVANVPVYRCGGCGALLQVKNRKKGAKSAGSGFHGTVVAMNELNHVSEDNEQGSLENEANPPSECLVDQNDCDGEAPGVADLSDEYQFSGGSHFGSTELVYDAGPSSEAKPEEGKKDILAKWVVGSVGSVDGLLSESPISELSGMVRDMAKSSITIGSHAYDGSVSSYDGLEDHRYMHPLETTHKHYSSVGSGDKLRRDRFLMDSNSMRHIGSKMRQHQPGKKKKKLYAMKRKELGLDELWEPTRRRHSPRNWAEVHEEYQCEHSSQLEKHEHEKKKLLRIIYELQNQLDKSWNLEEKANGRFSARVIGKEKTTNIPTSYNSHKVPHEKELSVIHHVHNCCTHCRSCPSSTQQYTKPHESNSDDQRFKDHVMKKYLKGKHPVAKRHFRPKAGGAPFVTCYHCSNLLHLPEDFLVLKRRCHRLSCGSCSTILKFSVQNRTHIIPYSSKAEDPPASEVDECSGVMDRRSTALSSHGSNFLCTDLVSCSDDYGQSSERNYVSFKPLHLQDNLDDKKLYAKKEFIRKQSQRKYKVKVQGYGPAMPSSSVFQADEFVSDSEVVQPRSTSPLHRLMGYSSPCVVIRGTGLSSAGTRLKVKNMGKRVVIKRVPLFHGIS